MYGCVYQGLHVEGGTFVAIKQVKLSSLPEDKYQGIQTEIELLQGLAHPNVVRYITCKSVSGYLNVVMEYVENGSLLRILNKFGKLPETLVAMYMSQVMQGLNYLHSEGVTHRDIKAANLLVTKDGTIKIADSGVASRLGNLDSPCWSKIASDSSVLFIVHSFTCLLYLCTYIYF